MNKPLLSTHPGANVKKLFRAVSYGFSLDCIVFAGK